jgi:hypothetical protein
MPIRHCIVAYTGTMGIENKDSKIPYNGTPGNTKCTTYISAL